MWDRDLGALPVDDSLGAAILPLASLLAPLLAPRISSGGDGSGGGGGSANGSGVSSGGADGSGGAGGSGVRWSPILSLPIGRTDRQKNATGSVWLQVT